MDSYEFFTWRKVWNAENLEGMSVIDVRGYFIVGKF